MDDLIRRQWLMECVNEGWIKFDTERDKNIFIHLVRDIAPPAQPELKWTPCSERLPKEKINHNTSDFEEVLCSTTFGDVRAYKFGTPLGWDEPHFWNGAGMMDEYVLAWMPLPKPWKGEEE